MSFLIETHYHTCETSPCGKASCEEAFPQYADSGYSAIVITDHYYKEWFDNLSVMTWQQKINSWLVGYKTAQDVSVKYNMTIILGMEIRFSQSNNDYLLYGIDESFLLEYPELYNLQPQSLHRLADEHGLFIAQAHPFRNMCKPCEPKFLHGLEIYNGNPRHNSNNDLAQEYASKYNLIKLSGSDFHQMEDACRGGIYLSKAPCDSSELASMLFDDCIGNLYKSAETRF